MIVLGCGVLAALGYFASTPGANRVPAEMSGGQSGASGAAEEDEAPDRRREQVTKLTPKMEGDDLVFEEQRATLPAAVDPMVYAVNDYLSQLEVVPKEGRVESCRVGADKVAILDFTPAFAEGGYATEDEMTVVRGILRVMGQFPEVDFVKFTVEGQPLETLGNIDLSLPQRVDR